MASEQPKEEDSGEANDSIDSNVQSMDVWSPIRTDIEWSPIRTVNERMVSGDNYNQSIDLNYLQLMDTNVGYPIAGENIRTASDYYNQSFDLNVLPTINASPGHNFAGGFGSPIANTVPGFYDMQNFPDRFSRVGVNERRRQDQHSAVYCSRTQNEGGVSYERYGMGMQDAGGFPSGGTSTDLLLSVGGSSTSSRDMSSPIPRRPTDRQSIRTQSRGMLAPVRPGAEYSLDTNDIRIQSFPTSSPVLNFGIPFGLPNDPLFREIRAEGYPNVNATNFQGSPSSSSVPIPNISYQVGAPNARITQNLLTGFPESSSSSDRIAQQLQNLQFGTFRNFSHSPISPFREYTRNTPLLEQSAQHMQANTSAAQAANFGQLGMNIGVRPATDQEMPAVNLHTLPLTFSPGPSYRRDATTRSSTARKVQFSKSRSIRPSGPPSSSSSSPSPDRPPELEVIKQKSFEPMGLNCDICKNDLSLTPDVPMKHSVLLLPFLEHSALRTTTAVLPCGHHFHASCLEKITPEAQAHDPPCITCAKNPKD